jgi:hypothetical protein
MLDSYNYSPLPSSKSIRLLEMLPREGFTALSTPEPSIEDPSFQVIQCHLKTLEPSELPVYDALSYTWGNPLTV